MAEPHVITGLKAERSKILATIERLEGAIAGHRADLLTIDAAIAIVAGKRALSTLQSATTRKRLFERGETGKLVFAALRRSDRPLSTQELVGLLLAEKRQDSTDRRAADSVMRTLGKTLAKFRQRGDVIGERRGNMTWWRLPTDRANT